VDHFIRRDGELYAEQVPLSHVAQEFGTPVYVYSRATLERHYRAFDVAFAGHPHQICYAVKANSNLAVLQVLARLGSGFDIVSGGELQRVLRAGGDARRVVYSGVGKSEEELTLALQHRIGCFNVESEAELELLNRLAHGARQRAPIALRVNPDVDARTHPYISTGLRQNKFGVDLDTAFRLYGQAMHMDGIEIRGIASHIGSQLMEVAPYLDALDRVLALVDRLKVAGITLQHLDVGGGLGVRYRDETPREPAEWAAALLPRLQDRGLTVMAEPGRAIAGNAGVLLSRVMLIKRNEAKRFAVVDAAMNDLLRPSLYDAWMEIVPVHERHDVLADTYDVVGPVCETGDFLGRDRELALASGDLLAVRTAGAYGFVMSSNYNSRPRAAEVMVDGSRAVLVRARESFDDLVRGESLLES
jgi:diaminopimelate decarboxylase